MTKNNSEDRRLIEDYLPIQAISTEASREKNVRKGHISTLHLWWARRPLVACRAAVYGTLVPASRFMPEDADEEVLTKGRKEAERFVSALCKYPGDASVFALAEEHILEAHAERVSKERGEKVTVSDIREGRAPRPRVLDMFAGGGAIPLEALRLGCETYALDLNPVAHIIELCTLVYPQRYSKPDKTARGIMGTKNEQDETTWGGLAEEVRHWGNWVLERVRAEIGDLYPLIPDPSAKPVELLPEAQQELYGDAGGQGRLMTAGAYLTPIAYLWTRTVRCKRDDCGATVPLVRQTWLRKGKDEEQKGKEQRFVAIRMSAPQGKKRALFEVCEATSEQGLGFDPAKFSVGGSTACRFCQATADLDYVKKEACAGRLGHQMMATVYKPAKGKGKIYHNPDLNLEEKLRDSALAERAVALSKKLGISVPHEDLEANPRSFDVQHFGFTKWRDVFTPRQLLAMTAFAGYIKVAHAEMLNKGYDTERAKSVATYLSMVLGKLADYSTSFCTWQKEVIKSTFHSPGLPMVMDYAEANPLADSSGSWSSALTYVLDAHTDFASVGNAGIVTRTSALTTSFKEDTFDAVITDPPYYDSRSYSNLSDHFYVWHKQAIGHLYREHFASPLTPKKNEAIAASYRHGGSKEAADDAYEGMMQRAFEEAGRLLKPGMPMVCVYAHKTTAGWSTLINSLRTAGFTVIEAWAVQMERQVRQNAQETAALASSIFLVARKRDGQRTGEYETEVRPELERIVRERVETLWSMGITGADLVIAAVGAGLRAFTRFARVEFLNGEEVPATRFLTEVEGVVLETLLEKIFDMPRAGVAGVDPPSRFYVLWRYAYGAAELDAGEAIVFAYPQSVELDGPRGLTQGKDALVEKKKNKYHLRDFAVRGAREDLGLPDGDAPDARPSLIDVLHRVLWLMENRPALISDYLYQAQPDRERLRLVAQALAGPGLRGGGADAKLIRTTTAEASALGKLLANWRTLVDARLEEFQLR